MKTSIQIDNIGSLREALKSNCSGVRFGSEFCEHLLPNLGVLEKAYELVREGGKEFIYVTPRLSNAGIERLKEQLSFLSEKGEVRVVVNDFGALNVLRHYPRLRPHLGRHLYRLPARSPWTERYIEPTDPLSDEGRWIRDVYASTSLNFQPTIDLYRSYGCQGADVDWIARIFPSLGFLVRNGLSLSMHLFLVPVTFTRKCHTARFLEEKSPEECSRPCLGRALLLRNELLEAVGVDFFLHGNAVFRLVQPSPRDMLAVRDAGVAEVVLAINPITRMLTPTSSAVSR
jgi:hypothetical protein